jgi:hypothetical protein
MKEMPIADMLRKHMYQDKVISAGSLHKSQIDANMRCGQI